MLGKYAGKNRRNLPNRRDATEAVVSLVQTEKADHRPLIPMIQRSRLAPVEERNHEVLVETWRRSKVLLELDDR